jgi:hypothetical protein
MNRSPKVVAADSNLQSKEEITCSKMKAFGASLLIDPFSFFYVLALKKIY